MRKWLGKGDLAEFAVKSVEGMNVNKGRGGDH